MRIVNALLPTTPRPASLLESTAPETSDSIPEEMDIQKVHPMSEAGHRRAYKKFILSEASRRRLEVSDLMFVHRRRSAKDKPSFGGITVVFKLPARAKYTFSIEIATCVCPAHMQLDKKFGANFAALNFLNRRSIQVPVTRNQGESVKDAAVRTITAMFP